MNPIKDSLTARMLAELSNIIIISPWPNYDNESIVAMKRYFAIGAAV